MLLGSCHQSGSKCQLCQLWKASIAWILWVSTTLHDLQMSVIIEFEKSAYSELERIGDEEFNCKDWRISRKYSASIVGVTIVTNPPLQVGTFTVRCYNANLGLNKGTGNFKFRYKAYCIYCGKHQLLVYAGVVNLFGENINTITKLTENILDACK
jgi:hypothetical protein